MDYTTFTKKKKINQYNQLTLECRRVWLNFQSFDDGSSMFLPGAQGNTSSQRRQD
jgi:hypothetical protein